MIPEPASFISYAITEASHIAEATLLIDKPYPFNLRPSDIQETGIAWYVTHYGATDVTPPPESYTTVSDQAVFGGGDANTDYNHGGLLSIPDGYEAIYATLTAVRNTWDKAGNSVDAMIGSETYRLEDGHWLWGTSLLNYDNATRSSVATGGTIPWAFNTFRLSNGVVSVEVLCRVTSRRKREWQAETHAKLLTAYKARVSEYEEKISRLKLQDGIQIQGTNPTANLNTIKLELKKNAISVLTAQHYEKFNSISSSSPYSYPEINLFEAEAEGAYVRFFEQAFEWDQISMLNCTVSPVH
jgi:hypothetical protein